MPQTRYPFALFSNFTYLLNNPVNGDEFEQEDERLLYGAIINGPTKLSDTTAVAWGAEFRHDDIRQLGLYGSSSRASVRNDEVDETSYAAFNRVDWQASDRLRIMLGLRADHYTFDVEANEALNSGFGASIRLRYLGEAPLTEDNSVNSNSSLLVNAALQYERGPLGVKLEVFNLTDSKDTDIAYFYESRLASEPAAGIPDVHYHPLEPRTVRLSVSWRFSL